MKKLLTILFLIPIVGYSQGYSGQYFKAIKYIDAPLFKISGTSIDTTLGTFQFFTKHKNDLLNIAINNTTQWTTSGNDIYYNLGKVGIGTNSLGSSTLRLYASQPKLTLKNSGLGYGFDQYVDANGDLYFESLNAGNFVNIQANLGLNKTPSYRLDVNGTTNATAFYLNGVTLAPKLYYKKSIDSLSTSIPYSNSKVKMVMIDTTNGKLYRRTFSQLASQWINNGSKIYYGSGNVGIGNSNPQATLHVAGTSFFSITQSENAFIIYDDDGGTNLFNINSNNKLITFDYALTGYKIGIGLSNPTQELDVNGSINGTSYYLNGASLTPKLYYQKSIDTLDNLPYSNAYIKLVVQDTVTKKLYRTRSTRFQTALTNPVTGTGTSNYLTKFTGTSTIGNSIIQDNGTNVGIGIAPATYKFRVEGSIYGSSTITAVTGITTSGYMGATKYTTNTTSGADISIYPQDKDAPYIRFGAGNDNTTFTTEWARFVLGGSFGIGTTSPVASAKVEIVSTTQGFLPPRMTTTQREAISTPAQGLLVYDLTLHKLYCYDGSAWQACW